MQADSASTASPGRARRPLIGIPCEPLAARDGRPPGYRMNRSYARAVAAAGGAPVLVPLLADVDVLRAIYERLDGVLLPGGGDVNPTRYGESPRPDARLSGVDDTLDEVEITLARWALADEHPLLGICRGQQSLNVAAGGTLVQDIPSQIDGALAHQRPEVRTALVHEITVAPNSRLANVLGAGEVAVNSIHHQAVAGVAPGFRTVATARDGVIEAIEHERHPFALAVQFHPEELVPDHTPSARLFAAFVAACRGE